MLRLFQAEEKLPKDVNEPNAKYCICYHYNYILDDVVTKTCIY